MRSHVSTRFFGRIAVGLLLATLPLGQVRADDYPSRPIHFIVGFAAGGSNDIVARIFANKLSEILKVPVPVENKPGANAAVAMHYLAESAPDGYTIEIAGSTPMVISPHTAASVPYDSIKDFVGITTVSTSSMVIAVNPSLKATNLKELVAEAKKAGSITMASSGTGGIADMAIVLFKNLTGVNVVRIPYTGGAPATRDVVGGQVQAIAMDLAPLQPFIKSGKLQAIAVTGEKRSPMLPELKTSVEQGYPDMLASNWFAIIVPARTPQPIVEKLHTAILQASASPDVKDKLKAIGLESMTMTSQSEFAPFLKKEFTRWGEIAESAKASAK